MDASDLSIKLLCTAEKYRRAANSRACTHTYRIILAPLPAPASFSDTHSSF